MRTGSVLIITSLFVCLSLISITELPAVVSDGFDFPVGWPDGEGWHHGDAYTDCSNGWKDGYDFLELADYLHGDGICETYHPGEDWNKDDGHDYGEPVYAVSNGTVVDARDWGRGWGKIILIEHQLPNSDPVWSQYAHLASIYVHKGEEVQRGQQIGTVGDANGQWSPHLHFEIRTQYRAPNDFVFGEYWNKIHILEFYADPTDFINNNRTFIPLEISSSLQLVQSPPYYVGQTITSQFDIINVGTKPITIDILATTGRGPGGIVQDFEYDTNVPVLNPGDSYHYQGNLMQPFPMGGTYTFNASCEINGTWYIIAAPPPMENTISIFVTPALIDLIPPPTEFIALGDTLAFTAEISNLSDTTQTFDAWLESIFPDSTNHFIWDQSIIIPPLDMISRDVAYPIPSSAPLGNYTIIGDIGDSKNENIWDSDSFKVEVIENYNVPPNIRLTNNTLNSEYPSIVTDSQGNSYVVWQDDRDGNWEVYFCKIDNAGNKIIPEINISMTSGSSIKPAISIDNTNNIYIVWREDGTVTFCKLDETGNKVIDNTPIESGDNPDIATAPDGYSYLVYEHQDITTYKIKWAKVDPAGVVNQIVEVFGCDIIGSFEKEPKISLDADDNSNLTWRDFCNWQESVYFAALYSNGSWYFPPSQAFTSSNAQHPAITSCGVGCFFLSLQDNQGAGDQIFWLTDWNVDYLLSDGLDPVMATDTNLYSFIAFWDDRIGDNEIYLCVVDNNQQKVGDDIQITESIGNSQYPDISVPNPSECYLVWQDDRDGNWEVYFSNATGWVGQ